MANQLGAVGCQVASVLVLLVMLSHMQSELYRLEANGSTLVRVSADQPAWVRSTKLNDGWLRTVVAEALMRWLRGRQPACS